MCAGWLALRCLKLPPPLMAISADHGETVINRRQCSTLQAVIDVHCDRLDAASVRGSDHQRTVFAGLLAGEPLLRTAFDAGRAADSVAPDREEIGRRNSNDYSIHFSRAAMIFSAWSLLEILNLDFCWYSPPRFW
jgi:hypothetical protein